MIITVAAQKGGVGKTTTAAALAQALTWKKKKTLLIDADAQGSATLIYGADDSGGGTYDLITGKAKAEDLIQKTPAGAIIPYSPLMDRIGFELNHVKGRDSLLKAAITPIAGAYDFILIDTAPGLGNALIQALTAANSVIIPLLCDPQALSGLHNVYNTIQEVRKKPDLNPGLDVAAVVLTQYNPRATLTRQYEGLITEQCEDMGLYLAKTRIRRGIAIQEAQAMRESLYSYAPKSNPAADYLELIKELKLLRRKA